MRGSMASCILLIMLSAYAAGKKPSMDDQFSKKKNFGCLSCLLEHAPQCIPLCFPNPSTPPCISCIVTAAAVCLKECGLPKTAAKVGPNVCTGRFDAHGNCGVYRDNCESGYVAVPFKIPFPPSFLCACSCNPKQAVESKIIFEENGETFEQQHVYSHHTKEAVITVPAHGDYPHTKFIKHGRSSNLPAAGKMVVSSGNKCSLEDIPAEINPEDLVKENHKRIDTRQMKEVKMYRIKNDVREATEEEQDILSESMKRECAGKTILTSSVEIVDEEEFEKRSIANFAKTARLQRIKTNENNNIGNNSEKSSRDFCGELWYGCAPVLAHDCVRWDFYPKHTPGAQNITIHYEGHTSYCINCCKQANTIFPQCSCIDNQQKFATAFAITSKSWGGTYDCTTTEKYTEWDPNQSISDCHYTTKGSCVEP